LTIREFHVASLNIGKPAQLTGQNFDIISAIHKQPVTARIYLSRLNFDGDSQADLKFHGGPDKAVCAYSHDHYSYWEQELKQPLGIPAFGENLTIQGLTEQDVCIGDEFQLGEALLQVSQPRQPCHKLAKKLGVADMAVRVQETGYTGFYFRVLREGWVEPGSPLRLIRSHPGEVTVSYANRIKYIDRNDEEGIRKLLAVEELSGSWRESLSKRITD
jgi:MOSC domain-containing protein YiiM